MKGQIHIKSLWCLLKKIICVTNLHHDCLWEYTFSPCSEELKLAANQKSLRLVALQEENGKLSQKLDSSQQVSLKQYLLHSIYEFHSTHHKSVEIFKWPFFCLFYSSRVSIWLQTSRRGLGRGESCSDAVSLHPAIITLPWNYSYFLRLTF